MKNAIDKIDFADSFIPPLLSGDYDIAATQESAQLGKSTAAHHLRIEGPRFQIGQEDVNSLYPPAGMCGSFGASLPHIVFHRKTLPWERTTEHQEILKKALAADEAQPSNAVPWICLLLLCGEEIIDIQTGTVRDLLSTPAEIYFPGLRVREDEYSESVRYMDMDTQLFLEIAPKPDELKLLSHARKLDLTKKHDAYAHEETDDWVSAVVGNRMPESSEQGVRNRAYAISLEGFENYDTDDALGQKTKVRFVILHSWDFYSITQQLHFKEMLSRLDVGGLALRLPQSGDMPENLRQIIKNGIVPMRHVLRNGDATVSFFRGPFAPIKREKTKHISGSADALYKYDPAIGMFDISYAAAWQRGRVLALADRSVAVKIMKMRINNRKLKHLNDQNRIMQEQLGYGAQNEAGNLEERILNALGHLPPTDESWGL